MADAGLDRQRYLAYLNGRRRFIGRAGFSDTSHLTRLDTRLTGNNLTFFAWIKWSGDATANNEIISLCNTGATTGNFVLRIVGTTGVLRARKQNDAGSAGGNADISFATPSGVWVPVAAAFRSNTNRDVYLGRTSTTNDTTSVTNPTVDNQNIGVQNNSGGPASPFLGEIAFPTIWGDDLGAHEIQNQLCAGVHPMNVSPHLIERAWWDFEGTDFSVKQADMSMVGTGLYRTEAQGAGMLVRPPVRHPRSRFGLVDAVVAGGRIWKLAGTGGGLAGPARGLAG